MTGGRAALIRTVSRYREVAMEVTLVEVQKLMYFLQAAGEPLKLDYQQGRDGPYADNLRHVLREVEGHYLSGYGDGSAPVLTAEPIEVLPGAESEATAALADHPETTSRIERVVELVAGFESMYGLELLASTHWVATHDPAAATDAGAAASQVRSWTSRKSELFSTEHVTKAWETLRDRGWLAA
jgi:O-acetyl-ADP-ribose deacetylase (regulator of RNase III)